jgi:hypothetical protein
MISGTGRSTGLDLQFEQCLQQGRQVFFGLFERGAGFGRIQLPS